MKITFVFVIIISISVDCSLTAQGSVGDKAVFEPGRLIDMPVAGILMSGYYSAYGLVFPGGGVMTQLSFGIFSNFNAGISYSGNNIIGSGKTSLQNYPGFHLKYRLIDEAAYFPATAIGLDIQGREKYFNEYKRFATMSPGLYIVMSKAFRWKYGLFYINAGINYSFEPPVAQRRINFFGGLEHNFLGIGSVCIEYNNNSDDKNRAILESAGMLNFALKFSLIKGLTIDFQLRDILENYTFTKGFTRNIGLEYITSF